MKRAMTAGAMVLCLALPVLAWAQGPADQKQKQSYIIGHNIGQSVVRDKVEVDPEWMIKGLQDGLAAKKSLLSDEETQKVMNAFKEEMRAKMVKARDEMLAKNKKVAAEFLAANAKKDGVKTTKSGLQYRVITAGKGASPKAGDRVSVNYEGKLIDGKVFDSTAKRGQPAELRVDGVIKGWREALLLMKEGDKWELTVPAELAYGSRGAPPMIEPESALVFEVELIKVNPPQKAPAAKAPAKGSNVPKSK